MSKFLKFLSSLLPAPKPVEPPRQEVMRPPPPPPENHREAFRRACTPWNYCRPAMNEDLINQLDYLVDVHGPQGAIDRIQELAARRATPESEGRTK